jgi:methionyl-tRNA formyltransferase
VIERVIRAYDPKPGAFTIADGVEVKCYGARASHMHTQVDEPGVVLTIDDDGMLVACGEGTIRIAEVHPSGKRRQTAREWAQGRGIAPSAVLGLPDDHAA